MQELHQRRITWVDAIGMAGALATVIILAWGDNLYNRVGPGGSPQSAEHAVPSSPEPSFEGEEANPTESDLRAIASDLPRRSVPPPGRVDREILLTGANAASAWTTSYFPFTPSHVGPPGGLADDRLRVGGWGDTYISLVKFDLPDRRPVRQAVLVLYLNSMDNPTSHPTTMILGAVTRSWEWKVGDRFLWQDRPRSDPIAILPAPSGTAQTYEIDITNLYNDWVTGRRVNQGISLTPMNNSNNDFNVFFSTRAPATARPRVRLTY